MSKKDLLRETLRRKWLTPLDAVRECQVMALSQRCGEFRKEGLDVRDKWVLLDSGAYVKAYFIWPSK